ncbi:MAG TPA: ABC transporter permease [Kiritimatiellia bacterium]|nr:ABC transporter permease [Kiritimatiellia bacterium]
MRWIASIGKKTNDRLAAMGFVAGVVASVVGHAFRPSYWNRTVRNVFARQILFTGYEATRFISLIAVAVGVSIVVQTQVLLGALGQAGLLGPVLVAVLVRELGPLLTNFVVIGRSGTAIATEMANMRVHREIEVLDAQGIDPFLYLVVPRVLGAAVSIFCLTVIFLVVAILTGFFSGLLMGANTGSPLIFLESIIGALRPADVLGFFAKTLLPGLMMGTICCLEGLKIQGALTEVPQASTRAVVKSTIALFVTSAVVSILTYL